MNYQSFIANSEIRLFLEWAKNYVVKDWEKSHWVRKSRFSEPFLFKCKGIEDATKQYTWKTTCVNPKTGKLFSTDDIQSTITLFADFKSCLANPGQCVAAAKAVLAWGGVRGAKKFIASHNNLHQYLANAKQQFDLDKVYLDNLQFVTKMDAGMTKIHSILSDDGLTIYDSRVAAAINDLVRLYAELNPAAKVPPELFMHCGTSRTELVRTPKHNQCPMFNWNDPVGWSQSKIKTSWIMKFILENAPTLFSQFSDFRSKMIVFQSGLFMIGYDLRETTNKSSGNQPNLQKDQAGSTLRDHNWQPVANPILFVSADGDTNKYPHGWEPDVMFAFPSHKWVGAVRNQFAIIQKSQHFQGQVMDCGVLTTGYGLVMDGQGLTLPYNVLPSTIYQNLNQWHLVLQTIADVIVELDIRTICLFSGGCPRDIYHQILVSAIQSMVSSRTQSVHVFSFGKPMMCDAGNIFNVFSECCRGNFIAAAKKLNNAPLYSIV